MCLRIPLASLTCALSAVLEDNCVPVCQHTKKLCAVGDVKSLVFCGLFYRLQSDGSAQVGLLCLRTRMCYKNTQCILTIKFEVMGAINVDKSFLLLMVAFILGFS